MSIPVIDTLHALGNFPVVDSTEVQCGNARLDAVLNASATELATKASKTYVDQQIAAKADKTYVDSENAKKVDKVSGKGLSTNDFTTEEKNKLAGIDAGANKTVVDSAMNSTSNNAVSNKAVSAAIANKADKSYVDSGLSNKASVDSVNAVSSAVDTKASVSTVSDISDRVSATEREQINLNARMDEFAKLEEGSTTGDAELIDARVSNNGTVYDNLKSRIDASESNTGEYLGNVHIGYTKNKEVNRTNPTVQKDSTEWESAIVNCTPGEIFNVKGYGGPSNKLWMFINSSGTIVWEDDAPHNCTDYVEITAPDNAAKLVLNNKYTDATGSCIRGKITKSSLDETILRANKSNNLASENKINLDVNSWERGFISTSGENSLNIYAIRMSGKVDISGCDIIHIDSSKTTSCVGRYVMLNENGTAVYNYNIQSKSNLEIPVAKDWKYMRIALASDWAATRTPINFVDNVSVYGEKVMNKVVNKYNHPITWKIGTFESGADGKPYVAGTGHSTFYKRMYSSFIPVGKGTRIKAKSGCMCIELFQSNLSPVSGGSWITGYTVESDCYIRLLLRYSSNNEEITSDMMTEMSNNWFDIEYVEPSDPDINHLMKNIGRDESVNIISDDKWDCGFVNTDGTDQDTNHGMIRTGYVKIPDSASQILVDTSKFDTVVGRYIFTDKNKNIIEYGAISKGVMTFNISDSMYYFRLSIGPNWNNTVFLDTSKGEDVIVSCVNASKDFYLDEIMDTEIKYNSISEAGRLGYIWISDLHYHIASGWDANNDAQDRQLQAVAKIANALNVDFVCIGGDVINGETTLNNASKVIAKMGNALEGCRAPIVVLAGNHDDNCYGSVTMTKSVTRNLVVDKTNISNAVYPYDDKCYYYFDIPGKKKRVFCLDSCDYETGTSSMSWWETSKQQNKWFANMLKTTPYDSIILSHVVPSSELNSWGLGDAHGYHTDLKNIISAYNNHTTITIYGVTYDYTNVTHKIKLMHVGHTHFDKNDFTAGGVPCIITSCSKTKDAGSDITAGYLASTGTENEYTVTELAETEGHYNSHGYKVVTYANRTEGSIKECLFDVVSVNSSSATAIRCGVGNDRTFTI